MDAEFDARLGACAEAVERTLDALLGPEPLAGEIARPERLVAAMRYATLGGGKRLRPFLLVESARLFDVEGEGPLRAGAALEMAHCYSLAHDDLPAMDDDDLRRGRPTLHKAQDEATAILAGDALLTYAFDVLADERTHPDPAVRIALTLGLARAGGLGGMAGGQMLDLQAEGRYGAAEALGEGDVRRLQAMKTGALLAYAVEAGAILGGADSDDRAALSAYGRALGAAFQVADDILDVESSADALGKATGKDAGRGKATLVGALGLAEAKAERDRLALAAELALAGFGPEADVLRAAARFSVERRS
ncbi:geranylgeranyl pyrophosphate synthase [Alsobacter metallidurans]|uniref:Probable farnesyl diphosphate synthase n=1 Tax=Alsobacter metallidurans TaxID=340221 RepID=A0A917MKF1_9HYPH|nr:farnesyl diphosphate synthase [Alsobacter metallidurans]GGH32428.1 geranylgeranyl pyrophosphate synthase [Alsobacter metallidurans]